MLQGIDEQQGETRKAFKDKVCMVIFKPAHFRPRKTLDSTISN